MLCPSDKAYLVSLGLKGLCQVFFMQANSAALLAFEVGVICSAAGRLWFALAGPVVPSVPTGSMTQQTIANGVQRKVECLIALEQALMQS